MATVPVLVGTSRREFLKDNQARTMQSKWNWNQCWRLIILLLWALPAVVQAQFTYTTNNGAITITGYVGSDGSMVIPAMTNGFPVTSIGTKAFYEDSYLTNISIPNGVTTIGDFAFVYTSLGSVTIPDSVTSIGNGVFWNCSGLRSVTIGNSVTNIGNAADPVGVFGLTALTNVIIPNSVVSIGTLAFQAIGSLTNVTFGNSVTTLAEEAFIGSGLTSLTLPNSVTNIGVSAFMYCRSLKSAITGSGVNTLGSEAFYECSILTNVILLGPVSSFGDDAFYGCSNLTSLTLSNVATVGNYAFQNCTRLTNFTIPASVTNIGAYAFANTRLTSLSLPLSVGNNFGDGAFSGNSYLTSVIISTNMTYIGNSLFAGCGFLTNVFIPDTVTSIGTNAFADCPSLSRLIIPASVTNLADGAFNSSGRSGQFYFEGNAPTMGANVFGGLIYTFPFTWTLFYLPGTTGWSNPFYGSTAILWNPQAQMGDGFFGVRTNQFGFNITGSSNVVFVVEASTNLVNPVWQALGTYTLSNAPVYFSDAQWTNYPGRYYRFRSP